MVTLKTIHCKTLMKIDLKTKLFHAEQLIIILLEEGRYSHQLTPSIYQLSRITNSEQGRLDKSIESLVILDRYLDSIEDKEGMNLEILFCITIYLSQVVILSCHGIWSIRDHGNGCFPCIALNQLGSTFTPILLLQSNLEKKESSLKSLIGEIHKDQSEFSEKEKHAIVFPLCELDNMIREGLSLPRDIPSLISVLSQDFNIPHKKLNMSLNSLKLIDESIRSGNTSVVLTPNSFNGRVFLALIIYIGEVLIKNTRGRWETCVEEMPSPLTYSYHWNIKIYDSKGRLLRFFTNSICDNLEECTYRSSRIRNLIMSFIKAFKEDDDLVWFKPESMISKNSKSNRISLLNHG
jgi:hypothetical protein